MRILHIVAGLPPGGGIAESVPMLCRHLRGLGHEVMLATLDGPMSEAALQAEKEGVRLVRFVPSWPRALYFSWAMTHGLAALATQADVVHVHSNWTFPVWWGCRCALRAGQPLVMSPRGCLDPVRLLHSAWKKQLVGWLDRYFLKRATVIHATAECERGWIEKYLGGNRQSAIGKEDVSRKGAKAQSSSVSPHFSFLRPRIVVIPNGVEVREVRKFESSEVLKCESWRHEVRGQRSEAGERSSKVRECESSKVGGSGTVGNRQSAIGNGENARKDAKTPSELEPAPLGAMEPLNLETSAQRDGTLEPLRLRTVLYLGRLHPLKGLDLLISAWAEIKGSIAPMALVQGFNRADGAGSKVTNEFLPWQLFIAGPDEQGEMTRLIAQAKNFGMTVSSQQLTVNGERLAVNRKRSSVSSEGLEEKEHERDGNKRLTAYRLPFTDIVFTGPVYGEEKMRLMATADLFVLPTRSENFGIVVAEALACGVPVITTKGAPWAELENCVSALVPDCVTEGVVENKAIRQSGNKACQPGRAGWWIDIGVEPLVEALKEAMSLTDEERRAMGENGRKLVESKYQWTEVARKMAGVYEKCVNAGLR